MFVAVCVHDEHADVKTILFAFHFQQHTITNKLVFIYSSAFYTFILFKVEGELELNPEVKCEMSDKHRSPVHHRASMEICETNNHTRTLITKVKM